MKILSLRYYPVSILVYIILGLAACYVLVRKLFQWYQGSTQWEWYSEILLILTSAGVVLGVLHLLNRHGMWPFYLKMLGLTDLRGTYTGLLISSYHEDDDMQKPHIRMDMCLKIHQNLNDIKVYGAFTTKGGQKKTSEFESIWCKLIALDGGKFQLLYEYTNKGNMLHRLHRRYFLNNHTGMARFIFDPADKSIEGLYYNYERRSFGEFRLTQK